LAESLKESDVQSVFLVNEDGASHEWVREKGFSVVGLDAIKSWNDADIKTTSSAAASHGCDAIAVDSHVVDAAYLSSLRDAGMYVIARDDLALQPFPCQMVINGNADADRLPYESSSGDTFFLLGARYMVLKEEFWSPVPRKPAKTVGNVLVIMGGTDPYDLMPKILKLLDDIAGDFTVTAVVGPFFHNAESVRKAAVKANRPVKIISSPLTVCDLMLEADLAISAAGQTLYELASAGCPTIGVAIADNQRGQLKALAEAGVLLMAGDATGNSDIVINIGRLLEPLLSDFEARTTLASAAQRTIDGQGACRVAEAIINAISAPTSIEEGRVACR
jgi:spore coat polysaccharide biosynthesis predicted glycosyltransferase SpsG